MVLEQSPGAGRRMGTRAMGPVRGVSLTRLAGDAGGSMMAEPFQRRGSQPCDRGAGSPNKERGAASTDRGQQATAKEKPSRAQPEHRDILMGNSLPSRRLSPGASPSPSCPPAACPIRDYSPGLPCHRPRLLPVWGLLRSKAPSLQLLESHCSFHDLLTLGLL